MLKISDLEEKKLIMAYFMARRNIGTEKLWRQWCKWWKEDFTVNGGALKMYNHMLVKSKTKTRERIKAGETDIQDFKEYDDFLAELYTWLENNYNKAATREENIAIHKEKLLKYKAVCANNIYTLFKKSGLKRRGYRLQNHTSKKHPYFLGKYLIFYKNEDGDQECVAQGSYEQMTDWINEKKGEKNKNA